MLFPLQNLDCDILLLTELPYNDYFEYYGPDFKLHISPSNMANQNTPEYMDKIKTRLFENLRMLPHAPGVQMADIPEDAVKEESEDEDKVNPDQRVSSMYPISKSQSLQSFEADGTDLWGWTDV